VNELPGIVTLGAELAVVHGIPVPGGDPHGLPVLHDEVEPASGTAVRTRRWNILDVHAKTSDRKRSMEGLITIPFFA
jgi:hypothetical protein